MDECFVNRLSRYPSCKMNIPPIFHNWSFITGLQWAGGLFQETEQTRQGTSCHYGNRRRDCKKGDTCVQRGGLRLKKEGAHEK